MITLILALEQSVVGDVDATVAVVAALAGSPAYPALVMLKVAVVRQYLEHMMWQRHLGYHFSKPPTNVQNSLPCLFTTVTYVNEMCYQLF